MSVNCCCCVLEQGTLLSLLQFTQPSHLNGDLAPAAGYSSLLLARYTAMTSVTYPKGASGTSFRETSAGRGYHKVVPSVDSGSYMWIPASYHGINIDTHVHIYHIGMYWHKRVSRGAREPWPARLIISYRSSIFAVQINSVKPLCPPQI